MIYTFVIDSLSSATVIYGGTGDIPPLPTLEIRLFLFL